MDCDRLIDSGTLSDVSRSINVGIHSGATYNTGNVVTGLVGGLHDTKKSLTLVSGGPKLDLGCEQHLCALHIYRKCSSTDFTTKKELRKEQALSPRPEGRGFRA